MKIQIRERLRPFSHTPGASCPVPCTHSVVTAFPTLLCLDDRAIELPFTGPVRGFTLQQDLERDCISVLGIAQEGRFNVQIKAKEEGIYVEKKLFPHTAYLPPAPCERLFLGANKAQDWDLVLRRFALEEILPVLFALGQKTPDAPQVAGGTSSLLAFHDLPSLEMFCRAAFRSLLVPRLIDDQHQGLCSEEKVPGNPFYLLAEAARRLRTLFVAQEGSAVSLLPTCFFNAGRMTGICLAEIGSLDIEWLKRALSRAVLRVSHTAEVHFDLSSTIKSFRVQTLGMKRPLKHPVSQPLPVEAGTTYFLDRFLM